jgi:uncharacterized protein
VIPPSAGVGRAVSFGRPLPRVLPAKEEIEAVRSILMGTPWLVRALKAVRESELPDWAIGAGAIRNVIWDHLHGAAVPTEVADLDVAFFDPVDTSEAREAELEGHLGRLLPGVRWDVKNQAGVHLWFHEVFAYHVEPLVSTEDGVATWPETATAVAVRLTAADDLEVLAPYGLADLLGMVLRRNPRRVPMALFRQRLAQKQITERWPLVKVIDG